MACKCKKKGEKEIKLTEEQEKILRAMAEMDGPVASKQISEATGIPTKSLSCRIRSLKNKGLLDSPARCKYEITEAGRQLVGA
ncbi:MAG: winged helix-turn-helix transcriptional regulator [Thermodesulfobacteria bacterium]|nr:winged helix-turn-helix transcriptional regulator [Thermodesulfobacteriota bacterium]